MRLLTALFSYNRYHLLQNTVESWREFGPSGDLLIMDDGSDDQRINAYFQQLKTQPRISIQKRDRAQEAQHGGLYANMTLATAYAIENKYSHIFFLQDDVQFMWKDPQFEARVEAIFNTCSDAAMVSPVFQRAITATRIRKRLMPHESGLAWHITPYAIVDMGIMPVQLLKERAWQFDNTEMRNSDAWKHWGYKLYAMPAPTVAFIPWPNVWSGKSHHGHERAPNRPYFLKPLSADQIHHLTATKDIPFAEDCCLPWGWHCLSPYWLTKFQRQYYLRYLWEGMKAGEYWPKWVGIR